MERDLASVPRWDPLVFLMSAVVPLVPATVCCIKCDTHSRPRHEAFLGESQGLHWGRWLYKLVLEGSISDPDDR